MGGAGPRRRRAAGHARARPPRPGRSTSTTLAALLAPAPGNVKTVLAAQSVIAGIGNAYSDEILHVARLSPFKPARNLDADEVDAAPRARWWASSARPSRRAVGQEASELKGDKKRAMRVHGRTGEACPVCGDVVREVSFATKSLQYCATCQTGGKPLADRRLSQALASSTLGVTHRGPIEE